MSYCDIMDKCRHSKTAMCYSCADYGYQHFTPKGTENNCCETAQKSVPIQPLEKLLRQLKRKVKHHNSRVAPLQEIPIERISIWGSKDIGYFEGRILLLEDIIDDLEEILKLSQTASSETPVNPERG